MKLIFGLAVIAAVCVGAATPSKTADMKNLKLVPMPHDVRDTGTSATLNDSWRIRIETPDAEDLYAADLLAEEARAVHGFNWTVASETSGPEILLRKTLPIRGDNKANAQGYTLAVEAKRIIISAPTPAGRFYGVQTLRQLIRTSSSAEIPGVEIFDYPSLEWRGISDDVSRGQVSTLDDFRAIIRELAYYKRNLYQPYIEDMFEFDRDPEIGGSRGHITKAEMAQMVEEARRNHIVLTPVFETLGHQDRLLELPQNRQFAELQEPEAKLWSFAPTNPAAVEFVKELVDELAQATPGPFFHIGGDESWDVGKGVSKDEVEKIGVGRVHARYFSELNRHIKQKHMRRVMLYSDMLLNHPDSLHELDKDAIIVDWHYMPAEDYPSVRKLKDAGFIQIMVSPAIWSWSTFYPAYDIGLANVADFSNVARREQAMGSITSSWGDNGAENLRENNITGYAYSAAAEWETVSPEVDEFLVRYVPTRYGAGCDELVFVEKSLGWAGLPEHTHGDLFHRVPRLQEFDTTMTGIMSALQTTMTEVRRAIDASRKKVKFAADHLDVLDHCARRFLYMADRTEVLDRIARMLGKGKSAALAPQQQTIIRQELEMLRNELVGLTSNFEHLWLRRNKFSRLEFNIDRLNEQVGRIQHFLAELQAGELAAYVPHSGVWIWYPGPDPRTNVSTGTKYFVREFNVDREPVSAHLKCHADDRATIYFNGKRIVEARYGTLATKGFWSSLKKGRNVVAVEASNEIGAAGLLLELTIRMRGGATLVITGDKEWRAAAGQVPQGWQTMTPEGDAWQPVMVLGKGMIFPWEALEW